MEDGIEAARQELQAAMTKYQQTVDNMTIKDDLDAAREKFKTAVAEYQQTVDAHKEEFYLLRRAKRRLDRATMDYQRTLEEIDNRDED